MGRGKIEIKKIENANSRQVTFSKRRSGLFKKAHELAVLCEAEVAVIIFSNTGKLFEFCNSDMKNILARYKKGLELTKAPGVEFKPVKRQKQEQTEPHEADFFRGEIEKLRIKQLQLLGKNLDGMGLQELSALEQQLNEGLICIKDRKEQVLLEQVEQYKVKEKRAEMENEILRRQIEEFRAYLPSTSYQNMLCIEYNSIPSETMPIIKEGSRSPEKVLEDAVDSDTTLQLGPPSTICRKRKSPDDEADHSNNSETRNLLE
ncbi:hypothetical protein ACP275_14G176300 [Erythranthe tilingii]